MKVNFLHTFAVHTAFRLRDEAVHAEHIVPHALRQRAGAHDRFNIRHRVVMMVLMVMLVFALFLTVHHHAQVRARDAALDRPLGAKFHTRQPQPVQLGDKRAAVVQQLQKRRRQHIARRAHRAVQIECFHRVSSRFACIWLMRLARKPAPKPLSMFTTDTPLAHELSIASSAATPPNDAP